MEMAEYLTYCRLVHMSVPLRSVIKLSIGVSDDLMVVIVTHHVLRPRAEAIRSGHGVGLSKRTDLCQAEASRTCAMPYGLGGTELQAARSICALSRKIRSTGPEEATRFRWDITSTHLVTPRFASSVRHRLSLTVGPHPSVAVTPTRKMGSRSSVHPIVRPWTEDACQLGLDSFPNVERERNARAPAQEWGPSGTGAWTNGPVHGDVLAADFARKICSCCCATLAGCLCSSSATQQAERELSE
jgi:hypothetical protein